MDNPISKESYPYETRAIRQFTVTCPKCGKQRTARTRKRAKDYLHEHRVSGRCGRDPWWTRKRSDLLW